MNRARPGRFIASAAFAAQWFLIWRIGLDWLSSAVDPYPYATSILATLALILSFRRWKVQGLYAICLAGLLLFLPNGLVATAVAVTSALLIHQKRWAWVRAMTLPLIGLLGAWALFPRNLAGDQSAWLGGGIGFAPHAASLAEDLGLITPVYLAFTWLALSVAAVWIPREDTPKRDWSLPVAMGCLAGLACVGHQSAPFLTAESWPGTLVLCAALSLLSGNTAPKPTPKRVRNRWTRRRLCLTGFAALGVIALLMLPFVSAIREVDRFRLKPRSSGYVPIERISKRMQDMTVAMEDGQFYRHHGFDLGAIHRALRTDIREARIAQGGSTISQQLAKNLFLTSDRTFARKIQEVFLTAALELRLSKRQILESYLNVVDYGFGGRGIGSAAKGYFHKSPAELSLADSAALVSLAPAPPRNDLSWERLERGRNTALDRLAFFFPGKYSEGDLNAARSLPLDHLIYPFKNAWDRFATESTPPDWHGVSFYYDLSSRSPAGLNRMHSSLKTQLGRFLQAAHSQFGLTGLDHLGVYNDRLARGSTSTTSAHAFGQAIDISGFRLGDRHIRVASRSNADDVQTLMKMVSLLHKFFDVVIDWRADPILHDNHIHVEIQGPRQFPWREP